MRILRPQSHGHGRLYPTHLPRRRYLRTWIRRSYPDYASEQSSAGAVSEVDKLFAKFVLTGPPPTAPTSTMTFPTSTSSMTLESLFAALSGPEIVGPAPPHTSLAPSASTPATGINLLDRIFASAANVSALSHQQQQQQGAPRKISSPTHPHPPKPKPKPKSSTKTSSARYWAYRPHVPPQPHRAAIPVLGRAIMRVRRRGRGRLLVDVVMGS